MRKLEIFDGTKSYMFPNNTIATPERIRAEYSAVNNFKCVIETDEYGEICYAIMPLSSLKAQNSIDSALSDTDAISALETILNAPPVINTDPTAEERIASALEFQNVLTMPTV